MTVRTRLLPKHPECVSAQTRDPEQVRFAADSPLEEDGFELVDPLSKRTAVPSSPFGFPVDGTGCGVLISENDDFEFPAAKVVTSFAKARASC
jgi:hypothetical protein